MASTDDGFKSVTATISFWYDENTKHIHMTAVRDSDINNVFKQTSVGRSTSVYKAFARALREMGKEVPE